MAEGACSDIEFVEEETSSPAADYNCPICLEVLSKPFLIECCRHHFCSKCINSAKQQKNECPLCKTKPVNGKIDKQFKKELNETEVYCSMREKGCEWTGKLSNLKNHLSLGQRGGQCKQVIVTCPNKCKKKFSRQDMEKHMLTECDRRMFTCIHCSKEGIYIDIVAKHYPECPNYPISCPNNCSSSLKLNRSEMPNHLSVCPSVIVSCPYKDVGCKVTMKRSNLSKHVESNAGVNLHQRLFFKVVTDLKQGNKMWDKYLDLRLQHLSAEIESKISSLKDECDKMEFNVSSSLRLHEDGEAQKNKIIAELCEANRSLEARLSSLNTEHAQLKGDIHMTRKENEALKSTVKGLQTRCGNLESKFGSLKSQLCNSNAQMIDKKMKKLHNQIKAEMGQMLQNQTRGQSSSQAECEVDAASVRDNVWMFNSLTTLQSTCSTLEARHSELRSQYITCKDEIAAARSGAMNAIQTLTTKSNPAAVSTEPHQSVDFWIRGYKLLADKMKKVNWKMYLNNMSEMATQFPDPVSPAILKVSGYDKAKLDKTTLVTSPFYSTGAGKYKFELNVRMAAYLAAYGSGMVAYMSVYASILKGEYDDLLTWPFSGSISVTLLNQIENAGHYKKQIWFSHDNPGPEYSDQVTTGQYRKCSWGLQCFISHWELESVSALKQYVVNDCMYFEVHASALQQLGSASNCAFS